MGGGRLAERGQERLGQAKRSWPEQSIAPAGIGPRRVAQAVTPAQQALPQRAVRDDDAPLLPCVWHKLPVRQWRSQAEANLVGEDGVAEAALGGAPASARVVADADVAHQALLEDGAQGCHRGARCRLRPLPNAAAVQHRPTRCAFRSTCAATPCLVTATCSLTRLRSADSPLGDGVDHALGSGADKEAPGGTGCPPTGAPAIAIARDRRSAAGPVADGLAVVSPSPGTVPEIAPRSGSTVNVSPFGQNSE